MPNEGDILSALSRCEAEAAKAAQQAVIIQPGGLGDCILTLPLAQYLKSSLYLGRIDLLSHTRYTSILPGRTCIDGVRCIDSVELHRLFVSKMQFDLADRDPLMDAFAGYRWILTFLGETDSDFEQNLIFTANCSHSAEVVTLALKPSADLRTHISEFYIQQFHEQNRLATKPGSFDYTRPLVEITTADTALGRRLLIENNIDPAGRIALIHPGSGSAEKNWPLENFLILADRLNDCNFQTAFLLGPAEQETLTLARAGQISAHCPCLTNLSLSQLLGLVSCTTVFIGNDSGPTHLAAAAGAKCFALFGPTNPAVYSPVGPAVNIFGIDPADFPRTDPQLVNRLARLIAGGV